MTDEQLIIAAATRVMEWKVFTSGRGSTVAFSDMNTDNERERILATTHPWESAEWNPLASDADAFMLVDKMAKRGYDFRIHSLPSGAALASFTRAKEPEAGTSADGPDRRRAIVLACLRACGVEV